MLILGLLLFGMLVGAGAQLIVGSDRRGIDWGSALVAGLLGSFVGGPLASLVAGDGLARWVAIGRHSALCGGTTGGRGLSRPADR